MRSDQRDPDRLLAVLGVDLVVLVAFAVLVLGRAVAQRAAGRIRRSSPEPHYQLGNPTDLRR